MKKYLILLVFSMAIVSCSDDLKNSENANLQDEIAMRGGDSNGPQENCDCESLANPKLIKTSESGECCEFTLTANLGSMSNCNIVVQTSKGGVYTYVNYTNEASEIISMCGEETVTITISIDNGFQIIPCWTKTIDCSTPSDCDCDVSLTQEECFAEICFDKTSCDPESFEFSMESQNGKVRTEQSTNTPLKSCVSTFFLPGDQNYTATFTATIDGEECQTSIPFAVDDCFPCSDPPQFELGMSSIQVTPRCNQADGLDIPVSLAIEHSSPCCPNGALIDIDGTLNIYNYNDPSNILGTFDVDISGVPLPATTYVSGATLSADCEDWLIGDFLIWEFNYTITNVGDYECAVNGSGTLTDYVEIEEHHLAPCCILPCDCEVELNLNGSTLEACVDGEYGWCYGPYTYQWSDPPFGTPNLPQVSSDDCNEIAAGSPGEYCITVTDARGCEATQCQIVN